MKTKHKLKIIGLSIVFSVSSLALNSCGSKKTTEAEREREAERDRLIREQAREDRYYEEKQRQRDHETGKAIFDAIFN